MKDIFFIGILACSFLGCTTTPGTGQWTDRGIWTGKVQMTEANTAQRKWVYVNWASDSSQDRMRIDVSAVLDVPIATFLKNAEGAHLWLFTEGHYFFSHDGETLFKHFTKLSFDPRIFYDMLGKPQPPSAEWQCSEGSDVLRCRSVLAKTQFEVRHGDPDRRLIRIEKDGKALRVRLTRSKVQVPRNVFRKLPTSQFQTFRL
jgi:hypothetical protein